MPAPDALSRIGYPLVTPGERALLDLLGARPDQPQRHPGPLSACLAALDAAGIMIRASDAIPISGTDWLATRIDYGHPFAAASSAGY